MEQAREGEVTDERDRIVSDDSYQGSPQGGEGSHGIDSARAQFGSAEEGERAMTRDILARGRQRAASFAEVSRLLPELADVEPPTGLARMRNFLEELDPSRKRLTENFPAAARIPGLRRLYDLHAKSAALVDFAGAVISAFEELAAEVEGLSRRIQLLETGRQVDSSDELSESTNEARGEASPDTGPQN